MSCGGNCDKSSSEQGSDPWEAFIGAAAQGAIGYSDAYSGLGGSLGDWDGAGVVASDLFGKKKKKKKGKLGSPPCTGTCSDGTVLGPITCPSGYLCEVNCGSKQIYCVPSPFGLGGYGDIMETESP